MGLSRTTFDQREPFYADLKDLLGQGFLSRMVQVGDTSLSLRSLHEADFMLVRHRVGYVDKPEKEWILRVVSQAVWMVDGWNLLGEKFAPNIAYQSLRTLPVKTQKRLFWQVLGLSKLVQQAGECLSTFLKEDESRNLWYQYRGIDIGTHPFTGLVGSVGSNALQRVWKAYNELEDARIEDQRRWAQAKLIASCNAPKAIKQLNAKEKQAFEADRIKEQKDFDNFYYWKTGVLEAKDGKVKDTQAVGVRVANSPDELEDEMRRWVSGELDSHDKIVQDYKNRVRSEKERREEERHQRLMEVRREMEEQGEEDPNVLNPLIGYTRDELSTFFGVAGRRTTAQVSEGTSQDSLYQKYIENAADPGKLRTEGGKIVEAGNNQNLQNEIKDRQVRLNTENSDE
jgi:hypothetical protein